MINLNSIQISLSPYQAKANNIPKITKKRSFVCTCTSQDENSDGSSSSADAGDLHKQEVLARIAMLQAEKLRVSNFIDEKNKYLKKLAEEANTERDEIGKSVLEDANNEILEAIDSGMQEFEESSAIRWQEIEKNDKILEEFEKNMERDLNENLFFKNLREKPETNPKLKNEIELEAEKLRQIDKKSAGSKLRRNMYLALMSILALVIGNATLGVPEADVEWKKVATLGLIFVGLVAQLIYEQDLSSTSSKEKDK